MLLFVLNVTESISLPLHSCQVSWRQAKIKHIAVGDHNKVEINGRLTGDGSVLISFIVL